MGAIQPAQTDVHALSLDAADLLAEVWHAASTGQPMRPHAARWLADGVARAVRRGEPLDASLGLSAPGQRSLQRQLQTLRRDHHLLRAVRLVAVSDSLSDWQRCQRLAPLARTFVAETWPRVRRLSEAPHDWPAWRLELLEAARTDIELPTSPRRLYDLVQAEARCSSQGRKAMLLARLLTPCPP